MMACSTQCADMVAEHLLLDLAERGAHRPDLRDDVYAVAVVLDHAGDAADLAADAVEAAEHRCLGFGLHV
jgi:hypothetical protein